MQLKKISNRMYKIKLSHKEVLKYFGSYSIFTSYPRLSRKKTEKIANIFLKNKTKYIALEIKTIKNFGAEIIILKLPKNDTKQRSKTFAVCFKTKNDFLDFVKRVKQMEFEVYSYKNDLCLITKCKNIELPLIKEYSQNFTTDNIQISVIKEYGKRLQ